MNYIIRIAFYKNSKTKFWWAIRFKQKYIDKLWEYSKYSHTELVFKYTDDINIQSIVGGLFLWMKSYEYSQDSFKKYNLRFSSSEVDWWTRFKYIEDDKWNWDYHDITVTKEEYLKVLNFCISNNNKKYDYIAIIFSQIF